MLSINIERNYSSTTELADVYGILHFCEDNLKNKHKYIEYFS